MTAFMTFEALVDKVLHARQLEDLQNEIRRAMIEHLLHAPTVQPEEESKNGPSGN